MRWGQRKACQLFFSKKWLLNTALIVLSKLIYPKHLANKLYILSIHFILNIERNFTISLKRFFIKDDPNCVFDSVTADVVIYVVQLTNAGNILILWMYSTCSRKHQSYEGCVKSLVAPRLMTSTPPSQCLSAHTVFLCSVSPYEMTLMRVLEFHKRSSDTHELCNARGQVLPIKKVYKQVSQELMF